MKAKDSDKFCEGDVRERKKKDFLRQAWDTNMNKLWPQLLRNVI